MPEAEHIIGQWKEHHVKCISDGGFTHQLSIDDFYAKYSRQYRSVRYEEETYLNERLTEYRLEHYCKWLNSLFLTNVKNGDLQPTPKNHITLVPLHF